MSARAWNDVSGPRATPTPQRREGAGARVENALAPFSFAQIVSAINGRIGSDIFVPPYQQLFETEYLPPSAPHWTDLCDPFQGEVMDENSEDRKTLQPRRLSLRVF